MQFEAESSGHKILMDTVSPLGTDSAMSPKRLMLASILGCTGMDIVSLLRKFKQDLTGLAMEAEGVPTPEGQYPSIFTRIDLSFRASGTLDAGKLLEAVELSQTKFCGVSAMISKAVPIHYRVELNGQEVGRGQANFWG